ncbi:MAG: PIN domain-containing protein [Chloroflexi bacterium]|nr:PIN domain-containing protein [Chloroflexota bacterium]
MALAVIDSGALIAFLDANDRHHVVARHALEDARGSDDRLLVPASAYSEALVGPYRRGPEAVAVVSGLIDGLPAAVEPVSRSIAADAASLRASRGRSLRLPDALVLATARAVNADRIITTDAAMPDVGVRVDLLRGAG